MLIIAGIEAWESLMLWCSECCSNVKPDLSNADLVKGNALAKTHIYAGFLCYNGSWTEAVEVYRKANMYRYSVCEGLVSDEQRGNFNGFNGGFFW